MKFTQEALRVTRSKAAKGIETDRRGPGVVDVAFERVTRSKAAKGIETACSSIAATASVEPVTRSKAAKGIETRRCSSAASGSVRSRVTRSKAAKGIETWSAHPLVTRPPVVSRDQRPRRELRLLGSALVEGNDGLRHEIKGREGN